MIILEVMGIPTPWSSHKGYGRRAYNPKQKQREHAVWQIKAFYNQKELLQGPIRLLLEFQMPIPKSTPKAKRSQMLNGIIHHITRPDATNLQKFIEDCVKGTVIEDDSQVVEITSRKVFGETPKTIIKIEKI